MECTTNSTESPRSLNTKPSIATRNHSTSNQRSGTSTSVSATIQWSPTSSKVNSAAASSASSADTKASPSTASSISLWAYKGGLQWPLRMSSRISSSLNRWKTAAIDVLGARSEPSCRNRWPSPDFPRFWWFTSSDLRWVVFHQGTWRQRYRCQKCSIWKSTQRRNRSTRAGTARQNTSCMASAIIPGVCMVGTTSVKCWIRTAENGTSATMIAVAGIDLAHQEQVGLRMCCFIYNREARKYILKILKYKQ